MHCNPWVIERREELCFSDIPLGSEQPLWLRGIDASVSLTPGSYLNHEHPLQLFSAITNGPLLAGLDRPKVSAITIKGLIR